MQAFFYCPSNSSPCLYHSYHYTSDTTISWNGYQPMLVCAIQYRQWLTMLNVSALHFILHTFSALQYNFVLVQDCFHLCWKNHPSKFKSNGGTQRGFIQLKEERTLSVRDFQRVSWNNGRQSLDWFTMVWKTTQSWHKNLDWCSMFQNLPYHIWKIDHQRFSQTTNVAVKLQKYFF